MFNGSLIRSGGNAKTIKGDKAGVYETAIMYLAPASQSLMGNVCPMAGQAGCEEGCLSKAGRAAIFNSIVKARIAKTQRYFKHRAAFMAELVKNIEAFVRYCERKGVKPAVRLNGTSDIQWEFGHPVYRTTDFDTEFGPWVGEYDSIFHAFPEVQFYDYTKVYKRAYRKLPANYALTLSYSNAHPAYSMAVQTAMRETGINVAVVYRTKELRDAHAARGYGIFQEVRPVIDGDETDMRFTDPKGVIVGLYAKGPARRDTTGFVVG
ncbi:hypothetical protein J1C56_02275 [Aminobacter anthyllidis]|uniref:Gene product 88 domain-containing protein n=1 Tax=Aminobacter anthyllidis TaxID=1035067 RepID=A0A9X1D405_9HYPH|nr:hypothetical protein [Aminobacter anthyllidis]MBT1154411.1 hypothetical protein [Aminobacter anthyllidis]